MKTPFLFLAITTLLSLSACEKSCDDTFCPCPTIDLAFDHPRPEELRVTLIDRQTQADISPRGISTVTISSGTLNVSLRGYRASTFAETLDAEDAIVPADYTLLITNSATAQVDTITNFTFDTFRCDNDAYCGRSDCVAPNKNLRFEVNGERYSVLDMPIEL